MNPTLTKAITEKSFQRAVIQLAELKGWKVMHINDSRGQKATGFPDLVLARDGFVIFAELKTERGKRTGDQNAWALALMTKEFQPFVTHTYQIWRPSAWKTIEKVLT